VLAGGGRRLQSARTLKWSVWPRSVSSNFIHSVPSWLGTGLMSPYTCSAVPHCCHGQALVRHSTSKLHGHQTATVTPLHRRSCRLGGSAKSGCGLVHDSEAQSPAAVLTGPAPCCSAAPPGAQRHASLAAAAAAHLDKGSARVSLLRRPVVFGAGGCRARLGLVRRIELHCAGQPPVWRHACRHRQRASPRLSPPKANQAQLRPVKHQDAQCTLDGTWWWQFDWPAGTIDSHK